ncbi:hypothetical protein QTO34_008280 [Cnephaeus nilssonii]|uniref:NAD(P)(+)--arginine ADP-ribosyltransferase n=1 Tax=Cnephaeus nilssonii TaxID=3371016 RepID=A0AA40IB94_CNENI|nr:hypothetical protein QTO34_008280 [Eptesicus nilssonii]
MKKDQLEIKHTLTEIKNIIQRPNSRLEERKNQVKDLKYKEAKNTQPEKQKEKRIQKYEASVRSLWDNFKCTNIRIMGMPEEERKQDIENLFEEMTENFPYLKRKMKTGNFEMVTMLLSAMILMNIFQVKANMLDMADNAFDDEYQKCTDRMEIKYVPQLLKEEKASHQLFEDVWENAKAKWEAQKTQLSLPMSFKDNHGIALMAYISEAQEQTSFYHLFNEAVKMAGQSRKDYIYGFQFKAFHFYLTKALQLLRRPCEDSYKNVVYSTIQGTSFTFGGLNQARLGHFTLAHSAKPQAASDQHILLTIHTCFGVAIGKFFDKENESGRIIIIPLNEIFHVSQDGASNNLILRSTNKTCSHYECAFLGGGMHGTWQVSAAGGRERNMAGIATAGWWSR